MKSIESKKPSHYYMHMLVGLAVLSLGFVGGWAGSAAQKQSVGTTDIVQQRTILKNQANLISDIASQVGPSVVSVNVTAESAMVSSPYAYFFGMGGTGVQQSAGTGIVLNKDGLIMTNRHVVPAGTTTVSVTLSDGTVIDDVQVLGRTNPNDSLDIAFLKVTDAKKYNLTPAKIGDSSLMKVGDSVVAIGNTLGQFQNTVTSGILSGYGRSIQAGGGSAVENLDDLFQTDAAINEGNSGGPLVNLAGEVVGVNTAIASGAQTVGFAIPINNVMGLIKSVETTGKLERPYLGVRYVVLTDDIAKEYNLKVTRGAYVPQETSRSGNTVVPGGPADKAGVRPGDVITKIDNTAIDEKTSIMSILGKYKVSDTVSITVQRGNEVKTFRVELAATPTN